MARRIILSITAVIVVIGAVGGVLIYRAVTPPKASAFYDAPTSIGSEPGHILRTQPVTIAVPGARLWRILYTSRDLDGKLVVVSGLIAAPTTPAPKSGYPLVAVAHGTVGINRGCAPSIKPFAKADAHDTLYSALVGQYVSAGYVAVMSDFEGLGVAGPSSYLVGKLEGQNVLDSARAAMTFPGLKTAPGLLIAGQSQGGHAALFAAQLAATYAPDLTVLGVVAQAPATNLEAMFAGVVDANKRGGIVALPVMAADAYAAHYPVRLDQVLTRRGRAALNNVVSRTCLIPAIIGTQLARPTDLITSHGLDILEPYVEQNVPGNHFGVPVFLAQGEDDPVVPPAINIAYAKDLCRTHTDVTFETYPKVQHFDVIGASNADVLAWMKQVRDGTPPASNCADIRS